jgi:RHS repeat-associated protein
MSLTVYLGPFEYHVRRGTTSYTKLVLHARTQDRHAQAERVLAGRDPESLDLFFHHADHLGSGHVLTGEDGDLLSQEEFFPYGRASDRRDARNRYRYIGVERDVDTLLCMTGPRTYDPVSGRFLQGDPIAVERPGASPFVYASASPLARLDPGGYADPPFKPPGRPPPRTPEEDARQIRERSPGRTAPVGPYDVPASPGVGPAQPTPASDPADLGRGGYTDAPKPDAGSITRTPPADQADLGRSGYGYPDTPSPDAGPSPPSSHGVPAQPDPARTGFDIDLDDQDLIDTEEVPRPRAHAPPTPVVDPTAIVDGDRLAREAVGEGAEWLGKAGAKKLFSIVPVGGIVGEFLFAEPGQGFGTTLVRGIGSEIGYGPIDVTTVWDVGSWLVGP